MFTSRVGRGCRSSRVSGERSNACAEPVEARQPPPSRPKAPSTAASATTLRTVIAPFAWRDGPPPIRTNGARAAASARASASISAAGRPVAAAVRSGPFSASTRARSSGQPDGLGREEGLVREPVAGEDVDDPERERAVGAGTDDVGPIGEAGRLVLPGLDEEHAGAAPPRRLHPRGEVEARRDRVDPPQDDEIRPLDRVRVRPGRVAHHRAPARALRRRADRPVEPGRAEPVEEGHPRVPLHEPHRARVGVRAGSPRRRPAARSRRGGRRRARGPRPTRRAGTPRHPSSPCGRAGA